MILGPISYIDCLVFLIFLAPQLLVQVGFFETFICTLRALPFLLFQLPFQLIRERYFTRFSNRSPFVQGATVFQDVVIRCVRYAFAQIPSKIGRVFFSKNVSLPFIRFRMLRHGYLSSTTYWREIERNGIKGIWIATDELNTPDVVVYYCHGGGFSMGSAYFYLEFLILWLRTLQNSGFRNPAIFALEYTLVPDQIYPTQTTQTLLGYQYLLSVVESDRICVSGDSAGGTLILSLLLRLGIEEADKEMPGFALLISPWTTMVSSNNEDTASDYLNAQSLHLYGKQYSGESPFYNPLVSPGACTDLQWWARSSPARGFGCVYGSEEVFAQEIKNWIHTVEKSGCECEVMEEPGGIHAWPVVALFLGAKKTDRLKGVMKLTLIVKRHMSPVVDGDGEKRHKSDKTKRV